MSKSLQLVFRNHEGKITRIAIDNPKEPIDSSVISTAMDNILAADIFSHGTGLAEKIEARLVDTTLEQIQVQ